MASNKAPSVPPWATLSSGAASGLASCLLLQPMDLLKTRLQQEATNQRKLTSAGVAKAIAGADLAPSSRGGPTKRTRRLVNTIKTILEQEGWRGLWRGTVPTVARNVPGVAMYFYSVSEIRALLAHSAVPYLSFSTADNATNAASNASSSNSKHSTLARLTVTGNLVSGAVARVAVGFLLSPITIVKARFESSHFSKDSYPSLTKALAQIYQHEGVKGLFRGFSATAMRDAPYAGIYLASYEKSKDILGRWERVGGVGGRGSGSTLVITFSGEWW
jgi:solute carrier family 25 protein 38